jgi:hypothetical protein
MALFGSLVWRGGSGRAEDSNIACRTYARCVGMVLVWFGLCGQSECHHGRDLYMYIISWSMEQDPSNKDFTSWSTFQHRPFVRYAFGFFLDDRAMDNKADSETINVE